MFNSSILLAPTYKRWYYVGASFLPILLIWSFTTNDSGTSTIVSKIMSISSYCMFMSHIILYIGHTETRGAMPISLISSIAAIWCLFAGLEITCAYLSLLASTVLIVNILMFPIYIYSKYAIRGLIVEYPYPWWLIVLSITSLFACVSLL